MYPALPKSAYGWSKLIGVHELELFSTESGIPSCSLIFHSVYGAPADFGPRSQVIPSLVRRAIMYPSEGDVIIWGNGHQGHALLHVDDAPRVGAEIEIGFGLQKLYMWAKEHFREYSETSLL